jgi:hypothetical protein
MKQLRSSPRPVRRRRPALTAPFTLAVLGALAFGLLTGAPSIAARGSSGSLESPAPTVADVHILSLSELQAELNAAQSDGQQRTVIADVTIDTSKAADHQSPQCLRAEDCPIVVGEIAGVPGVPVWTSPDVAKTSTDSLPAPANGPLALSFADDNVIMLVGTVVTFSADTVLWPASESALAPATQSPLQTVVAVHGWLSWTGPLPCPLPATPTPPPNSPFVTCPGAWITAAEYQPVHARTVTPPNDGIRVQPEAYNELVPQNAGQVPAPPFEGTWLLQLVEDPRPNRDPQRGWQLVGQLDSGVQAPEASPAAS